MWGLPLVRATIFWPPTRGSAPAFPESAAARGIAGGVRGAAAIGRVVVTVRLRQALGAPRVGRSPMALLSFSLTGRRCLTLASAVAAQVAAGPHPAAAVGCSPAHGSKRGNPLSDRSLGAGGRPRAVAACASPVVPSSGSGRRCPSSLVGRVSVLASCALSFFASSCSSRLRKARGLGPRSIASEGATHSAWFMGLTPAISVSVAGPRGVALR